MTITRYLAIHCSRWRWARSIRWVPVATIRPIAVKTVSVQAGSQMTTLSAVPSDSRRLAPPTPANTASVTNVATVKSELPPAPPGAGPGILGVLPVSDTKPQHGASLASATTEKKSESVVVSATTAEHAAKSRGGWMIQVGAFPDETNAKERLNTAKAQAKEQLGQADPFTEKVAKGDKALYRARFAGLDKDQAENACKNLKRSEIPCMLLKN